MTTEGTTKYLVIQQSGEFVLELPTAWKLTFGAVNPGAPPHGRDLHCLRVWATYNSGKGELRAVFCDVRGFRDLSIPLARKVNRETGSSSWTMDSAGNFDGKQERRQLESEWLIDDDRDTLAFE